MATTVVRVAMFFECPLGIWRSYKPGMQPRQSGKKKLYLSPFPVTVCKILDTNMAVFLIGSLRGGNLKRGMNYEIKF